METSLPQPPDEVIDFLERLGEVLAAQVLYGSGKDEAAQALLDDKTWTP